jgi:hypothetical protein
MVRSGGMRWARHIEKNEMMNAYKILVKKIEGKILILTGG